MEAAENNLAEDARISPQTFSLASFLFTLGIFLATLGPLSGALKFWNSSGFTIFSSGTAITLSGLLLITAALTIKKGLKGISFSSHGLAISLLCLLCSDWMTGDYTLLKGPEIRGEILLSALLALPFIYTGRIKTLLSISAFAASAFLLWCFFDAAGGRFIFSDDHSVVLYRLQLLKENFPFIPFYNPFWNAGLDARDFFATGTLNLFFIGAPLIYLFELTDIYNLLIGSVLFLLAPALAWSAARLDKQPSPIPAIAAVLTLTNSLFWYRWCLKYGSMGFVTATLFVVRNLVFAKKIIDSNERITKWQAVIFVITASLMLMWSLTGIIFLPVILWALLTLRRTLSKKYIKPIIIWLLVINIPWIILFLSVSKVTHFISVPSSASHETTPAETNNQFTASVVKGKVKAITPSLVIKHARDYATPLNPLLLIFALSGLCSLRSRSSRFLFSCMSLWLLVLGLFVAPLKPQLELDRMLIVCGFVLAIPAASSIWKVIEDLQVSRLRICSALISGMLIAGIFSVGAVIYNRSPEKYTHVDDAFYNMSSDLKNTVGEGRGVFLGFVLHELGNGHLAPLMHQSEKPLIASTLFHNVWSYTDILPKAYQEKGDAGVEEFLDLMNATVVIAHEKRWREYLFGHPEQYEFISKQGVFNLFKRKNYSSNYFYQGNGSVLTQDSNSVSLRIDSPEAVIKFQHFPFLKTSGCSLSAHLLPGDIEFVKLTNCTPGAVITLKARSGFARLLHE